MKICPNCFRDEEIAQYIMAEHTTEDGCCDYCSQCSVLVEIEELFDFFTQFIAIFKRDEDGLMLSEIIQNDWQIFNDSSVCHHIMSDILLAIHNNEIDSADVRVSYNDEIVKCVSFWYQIKDDLKCTRRFTTDITTLEYLGWDSLFRSVFEIDKRQVFYRARINEDNITRYKADQMGVPPKEKSTSGMANPQGIPYLYLSKTIETTLHEARSLYLDNLSIGTFKVKNGEVLDIVDMTGTLNPYRSPFVNDNISLLAKSKLLMKAISADLSKPMRHYDSELEYIPTQFICEYIKYYYDVDGIMFKSALHSKGVNYVIFSHEKIECVEVEQYKITDVMIRCKLIL